jgi:hypothetical protein
VLYHIALGIFEELIEDKNAHIFGLRSVIQNCILKISCRLSGLELGLYVDPLHIIMMVKKYQ